MTAAMCLYFGTPGECQWCGGSAPLGVQFCSHECSSGYEDWLSDPPSAPFFCDACGTDDDSEHWEPCRG